MYTINLYVPIHLYSFTFMRYTFRNIPSNVRNGDFSPSNRDILRPGLSSLIANNKYTQGKTQRE